jgi:hypothetical protein
VLGTAVAATIAAQLVTAQPSAGGWLAAVWPALAFIACVVLVEFAPRPMPGSGSTDSATEDAPQERPQAALQHDQEQGGMTLRPQGSSAGKRLTGALAELSPAMAGQSERSTRNGHNQPANGPRVHGRVADSIMSVLVDGVAMSLPDLQRATQCARTSLQYQLDKLTDDGVLEVAHSSGIPHWRRRRMSATG